MSSSKPPPKPLHIAFDLDGTLANSFPLFLEVLQKLLNRRFSPQEVQGLRQYAIRDLITVLGIKPWQVPLLIAKGKKEIDRRQQDIGAFSSIPETLQSLHGNGHKLYIVSSHSAKGIASFLKRYNLEAYFTHIYGNAALLGKASLLKRWLADYRLPASRCLFVGDEIRDIQAARKANIRCIAVSWGFNAHQALQRQNPFALVHSPDELMGSITRASLAST